MGLPDDISGRKWQGLPKIARLAEVGIEIRSSKYYEREYEKKKGKPQSFTPKLEDLPIVMRWIIKVRDLMNVVQVFFDNIYNLLREDSPSNWKDEKRAYQTAREKSKEINFLHSIAGRKNDRRV